MKAMKMMIEMEMEVEKMEVEKTEDKLHEAPPPSPAAVEERPVVGRKVGPSQGGDSQVQLPAFPSHPLAPPGEFSPRQLLSFACTLLPGSSRIDGRCDDA